jgi:thioredoxin-dependent peroxiredoxin
MEIKTITRDELVKLQNSGKQFKLIDVLDSSSYAKGHLPKAISIPIKELREKANKLLSKDELVVVYCGSFDCQASTTAAKILIQQGFKNVLDYKGGLQDYKEGNLPLEVSLPKKVGDNIKTTMQGKPLTLVGRKIKVGQNAANFKVVDGDLNEVTLDKFKDKIKVITSFVSLDTPVCDLQVKEFNKKAAKLSSNVIILGISKDLPFAQQRFCIANNIESISLFSDFKNSSFGINYGLLIKENNLLARATIILDANNIIRFIEIVDEITTEPNYENILNNLSEVINTPPMPLGDVTPMKCTPCQEGTSPLDKAQIDKLILQINGWEIVDGKKIVKEFKFKDFIDAKYFLDLVAIIAEEQGHHPNLTLIYNKLKVTLTTHMVGGLTDNDFIMAKIIDEVRS